jgi:lysophospholipase L1-like esterase
MNYVALGDSISIDLYTGVEGGGAASQFAKAIGAKRLQNLAFDGCTTEGALVKIPDIEGTPDLVTVTAGGNDLLKVMWWGCSVAWEEEVPLAGLDRRIATFLKVILGQLAPHRCPAILNTIYDPTDGNDEHALEMSLTPESRDVLLATNECIRELGARRGMPVADLERLFRGHGFWSDDPWLVQQIEPNLAGATAIASEWVKVYASVAAGTR